jgi:dolichol-phosphate mannosyltransferase
MNEDKRILIIIPTYNEKNNIQRLVEEIYLLGVDASVLVVDDNSPDGTSKIVSGMQNHYPGLFLITRKRKQGLGDAYKEGFRYALKNGYDTILQMDADLSHQPRYIPDMLGLLDKSDTVIGSRYIALGGVSGWPVHRILLSRFANGFSKRLLGIPVHDSTSGFRCFTRHILTSVDLNSIKAKGYAFQIEMAYRVFANRFNIVEYPIVFYGRKNEASKMSFNIALEAFFRVLYLSIKRYML